MADEIASLVVKITGDASDLERTINGVASELTAIEKTQASANKGLATYTKHMTEAETTLQKSRTALANTKKAYEDNQKSITKNVSALKTQKTGLENLITAKNNEIKALEHSNSVINKGSVAYKDNLKAIEWTKNELSALEQEHTKVSNSIRTQESALAGSKKAYADALVAVDAATKQYEEYEKGLEAVQRAESAMKLQSTGKHLKEVGEGIDSVTKPLQYSAIALATGGVAAAKFAIDFEDSFASVKKTVDGTPEQLEAIKKGIIDLSTTGINGRNAIPLDPKELSALAAAGGQLGIQTENIVEFTETMAQLQSATNLVGEQGASTMARYANVMKIPQNEIRNVGSAIVDLGNNSATTEAEIAEMALRMGKYGQTVGMGAADVLGYSAALSSLGIEAQLGGSAVGRTWLAIETAVASGGKELKAFAKYAGVSAKEFKQQWNTDSKGAFNGLLKGLKSAKNLTLALDDLGINNTQDIQTMMALVNGYDLVTESVERANTAYVENTALQEEFDKKAETTASKLLVTKNNLVEAARSIGETLLPTVADASTDVAEFAQKLAGMSDESKKTLVNVAGGVIAVGAASKGLSVGVKTAGDFVEGWGKLKDTKVITGIAKGFAAIPLPAKLAVAGIAAVGIASKAAYSAWYDSQYRWSEGLSEGNEKIQESLNKYKSLTEIQNQIKGLKLTIENPESSKAQVDDAKKKLEEIKKLLSEEYNLVINSDNSDLDEKVEQLKTVSKNDLQYNINVQQGKLQGLQGSFDSYEQDYADKEAQYEQALKMQTMYSDLRLKVQELHGEFRNGKMTLDQYALSASNNAKELGFTEAEASRLYNELKNNGVTYVLNNLNGAFDLASQQVKKYSDEMGLLTAAHDEYIAVSTELANWHTEMIKMSALEGDSEQVTRSLESMGILIRNAGLDMSGYAQAAALAMNGVDSLATAWDQAANGNGAALDGVVNGYIQSMQAFKASAEQTAVGAALIKNGFTTMEQAMSAGKFDIIKQQANELAHALGLIPENKNIEFTTNGEVIETTVEKVKELDNENVHVSVSAEGDLTVLNQATGETKYLNGQGATYLQVNAEGNIDVLNEAGEKVAEIKNDPSATITVNAETGEIDKPEAEDVDTEAKVDYSPGDITLPTPDQVDVEGKIHYKPVGYIPEAKGTTNFPGGLAMVNDQTGIADNRELIVDRGLAFIPQGRNVILPLSKGAKVYTASQTKAIMRGLGIPHYASGKNNSDAFTLARDNWNHYTRTHAVTTTQELEKWLEFQEQYKENEKDIWDIEEQIFSLQQKLYSERVRASEKWLEHETKYNGMSTADYLAGIDRMKAYTAEYYAQGIISHEEYNDALFELDEKYLDKRKEQLEEMYEASKAYISEHTYFNDWSGDDPLSAYNRVKNRQLEALKNGELTQEEYDKYMSELGSTMLSERTEQSRNWLDEQRKYFGMSDEEYVAGLERIKAYTQQYYDEGLISRQEYNEAMTELNHSMWDEAASAYDEMLSNQQDYISDLRQQFSDEEQALRDSWTVEDRVTDMADVKSQLDIYKNAVTDRGQQKYKELQEQMKQLQREEELYQLEVANNAVIEKLEAEYEQLEADKAEYLKGIAQNTNIDVSGIVGGLTADIQSTGSNITSLLSQILGAFSNFKVEMPTYTDNKQVIFNEADKETIMAILMKNVGLTI